MARKVEWYSVKWLRSTFKSLRPPPESGWKTITNPCPKPTLVELINLIEDISYSAIWLHDISKINGWKVMFSHIDPSKEGSSAITAETVIQSQNQTQTPIQWDPTYIKSLPGVLKICSMVSWEYFTYLSTICHLTCCKNALYAALAKIVFRCL